MNEREKIEQCPILSCELNGSCQYPHLDACPMHEKDGRLPAAQGRAGSPPDRSPEGSPRSACSSLTQGGATSFNTIMGEIATERMRQMNVEGWTPEHDDQHTDGEIARAAACYARGYSGHHGNWPEDTDDGLWPWHPSWWKPTERRRDLVKAAALIVAEIERLDRAAARISDGSPGGVETAGLHGAATTARPSEGGGCPTPLPLEEQQ